MLINENKTLNTAHKIEVFSAGCKFCGNVENEVMGIIGSNDTLITYNLKDEANADEYYKAAGIYGINSVPSVVVDGKLLRCCVSNGFNKDILIAALT